MANEALEVVAGRAQSFGSAVDRRVATLDRPVGELAPNESIPTEYEVGAIFQITPTQARNVLRTYQARFSEHYRDRLQSALGKVNAKSVRQSGTNVYVFPFDDPAVLQYASFAAPRAHPLRHGRSHEARDRRRPGREGPVREGRARRAEGVLMPHPVVHSANINDEIRAAATMASLALALLVFFTNMRHGALREHLRSVNPLSLGTLGGALPDLLLAALTGGSLVAMAPLCFATFDLCKVGRRTGVLPSMFGLIWVGFAAVLAFQLYMVLRRFYEAWRVKPPNATAGG